MDELEAYFNSMGFVRHALVPQTEDKIVFIRKGHAKLQVYKLLRHVVNGCFFFEILTNDYFFVASDYLPQRIIDYLKTRCELA